LEHLKVIEALSLFLSKDGVLKLVDPTRNETGRGRLRTRCRPALKGLPFIGILSPVLYASIQAALKSGCSQEALHGAGAALPDDNSRD